MQRLVAITLLVGGASAASGPGRSLDYLYLEANEGSSSGGHAALRLGDTTFHYQHEEPGLLRLVAEPTNVFDYQYRVLQNRTIHLSRIPLDDDTFALLRAEFTQRLLTQARQAATLDALHTERVVLGALLARRHGAASASALSLNGPGYFFAHDPPDSDEQEPALVTMRAEVAQDRGDGFLANRMEEVQTELARLSPTAAAPVAAPIDAPEPPYYGFAQRYEDHVVALRALAALATASALRADGIVAPTSAELDLTPPERVLVPRLAAALRTRVGALLDSQRPDWGYALVVGMARLAALERTRTLGRWVFLDTFPADAVVLEVRQIARYRGPLLQIAGQLRDQLANARRELVSVAEQDASFPEAAFARLEATANRWHEAVAALDAGRPLRLTAGVLVPAKPITHTAALVPWSEDELRRAAEAAAARERGYTVALERTYGYNLVTRNCVTELFRTLDTAFAHALHVDPTSPEGQRRIAVEATRRLGGHVQAAHSTSFIPFVSAATVDDTLAVGERAELPSYRRENLARLSAGTGSLRVYLREANTLTSTLYRPNPDDSVFLFFTDDVIALRPMFGLVNLASGLAASMVGAMLVPADHGHLLRAGMRGALFSVPELFFINIRKGSYLPLGLSP